jgi:hypothetical protein
MLVELALPHFGINVQVSAEFLSDHFDPDGKHRLALDTGKANQFARTSVRRTMNSEQGIGRGASEGDIGVA